MRHNLFTHFARAVGLMRPAPAPPFGAAWFDAGPSHDRLDRPRARRPFSEEQRAAVWAKAQPILGWDPDDWRVDHKGNPIFRQHYRDAGSAFGWEVARILPDGGDDLANLRPQLCQTPEWAAAQAGRTLNLDPYAR